MELLTYINSHSDWRNLLAANPYNLDITDDGDYYILKYNQIESDFSYPLVREARGCIVRFDVAANKWICVCHPFDKFFNYGERYSAVSYIDWENAVVQEKIDGSLIKIWYDQDEWHISTNGTIDAYKAECGDLNFGVLVEKAIAKLPNFWSALDPNYTYMFELTSPFNHIVIRYEETTIWFLGRRNNTTDEEDNEIPEIPNLRRPRVFPHHSLADCVEAAHQMGKDEEGYVVVDEFYNRIKVKGDEYLRLHKIRGNGPLTVVRVLEMWQEDSLDDFIAYYPEFKSYVDNVMRNVNHIIQVSEIAYNVVSSNADIKDRRDYAVFARSYMPPIMAYLFARLDNKTTSAKEFFRNMRPRSLAPHVIFKMNVHADEGEREDYE